MGAWQAVGKAKRHIMAVAAAGRKGSLKPAAGAGVGQGDQKRGPPCLVDPLLGESIPILALPGGFGGSLVLFLHRPRGATASAHPSVLRPARGSSGRTGGRSSSHNGSGSGIPGKLRRARLGLMGG